MQITVGGQQYTIASPAGIQPGQVFFGQAPMALPIQPGQVFFGQVPMALPQPQATHGDRPAVTDEYREFARVKENFDEWLQTHDGAETP